MDKLPLMNLDKNVKKCLRTNLTGLTYRGYWPPEYFGYFEKPLIILQGQTIKKKNVYHWNTKDTE